MGTIDYVKNFVTDKYIASITPTSSFGVRRVCRKIHFKRCGTIVEYGPGTGVFTRYLLQRMRPDASLVLIERNGNFASILKERITDPRVAVFNDSAENVLGALAALDLPEADCIISGIPFSFLTNGVKETILRNTHTALREGGRFLAYQTFYQADDHLKSPLERIFRSVRVEYEMLNIPPIRVYEAVK